MKKAIIILSAFLTLLGCKAEQEQIPQFSDITLLAGGYSPKKPDTWTEDRARAHVTYTDESGKEHWLFEAFIFWAGRDYKRGGLDFAITAHNKSAVKESWLDWIDYWFNEQTGAVKVLDATVANAKSRLGEPAFRHKVVATLPTPVMFETFADKTSSTT